MLASLARGALRVAAPPGPAARLSVLIYHRVLPAPDPLLPGEPTVAEFERSMRWVRDTFNVIPLEEGIAGLQGGRLPARALAITFDDGYANNETLAAPVLARLGLHATFFIATGFLDGGRMFNDTVVEAVRAVRAHEIDLEPLGLGRHATADDAQKRAAIAAILEQVKYRPVVERRLLSERIAHALGAAPPDDLMMRSEQVHRLARMGFALGGHTVEHPILARLGADAARREIVDGHRRVQELADGPVRLFAYPNGRPERDYTAETVRLVREAGFAGAVSTSPGAARVGSDPYQIPRFTPWETGALRFAARMWSNACRVAPSYSPA